MDTALEHAWAVASKIEKDGLPALTLEQVKVVRLMTAARDAEHAKSIAGKCVNDTDGDGDCHLCAKRGGCPLKVKC